MPSVSALRDAFAKFDANGDGVLSVEELVGVFTRPVDDGEPMTEAAARAFIEKHDKNADGRLDLDEFAAALVAEQVEQPLKASHFREQGRLALLVLGHSTGGDATTAGADIRLLSARKLVAHIDGGGKMEIRQALEAAGTDVFLDAATVRGLLPELETKDDGRCTFSGVGTPTQGAAPFVPLAHSRPASLRPVPRCGGRVGASLAASLVSSLSPQIWRAPRPPRRRRRRRRCGCSRRRCSIRTRRRRGCRTCRAPRGWST